MVKAKKWVLATQFEGAPKDSNFRLEEEELPAPKDGEFICEAIYLSVDPYMRAFNPPAGQVLLGEQVARVTESKNKDYRKGDVIQLHSGWRSHTLVNPAKPPPDLRLQKVPDLGGREPSIALGVIGMPGSTAYMALHDICKPKAGEVVVVDGAAGAVGSLVGQIAKAKGCKVYGFAGTDEKCKWVKGLGFDDVFNYKKVEADAALKKVAPDGVDCFFDNVGGKMAWQIISCMKLNGRVALVGGISGYNAAEQPKLPLQYIEFLVKRLTVQGFVIYDHIPRWPETKVQMLKLLKEGKIRYQETIRQGFNKMPQAFMELFSGGNTGKMVVKA